MENENPTPIALDWASSDVRRILGGLLDGGELSVDDGIRLTETHGRDLQALTLVADEMRHRQAGDVVTYVVNRNINFTNVCIKHCTFCAFSRDHREEEGYFLPIDEIVRRAHRGVGDGRDRGLHPGRPAPEARRALLHRSLPRDQGGAARDAPARLLAGRDPVRRRRAPGCRSRSTSPSSRRRGSARSPAPPPRCSTTTSAIVIARGRITVEQWIEVITSAHALGIRTTSTIMYGHVETAHPLDPPHGPAAPHPEGHRRLHRVRAPLPVHQEAPDVPARAGPRRARQGATGLEVVKMHALARLFLGPRFRNIQCSWVKEGPEARADPARARGPTTWAAR